MIRRWHPVNTCSSRYAIAGADSMPSLLLSVTVCVVFAAVMFVLAMLSARRATAGDLK